MKGAIARAEELKGEIPGSIILQQFATRPTGDPPPDHREEIWNDTHGQIDYFVSGVGTGGTITVSLRC